VERIEKSVPPSDSPGGAAQTVEQRLKHWNVPGVSVAVFGDGAIRWAKTWGVTDATTQSPATTTTRFQAGSISKPITATVVLELSAEGRLSMDEDINRRLRSWKLPDTEWSGETKVTAARLINHTAGISVKSFPGYASSSTGPTLAEILDGRPPANTPPIRVTSKPGAEYRYSGGGYVILQQAISDIEKQPFERVMRRRLLDPLGMTSSTFAVSFPDDAERASGHTATGARVEGKWHVYPESAAAGLWSTPTDLARYAMAIQAALQGRRAIVSRQAALWMTSANGAPTRGMAFDLSPSAFYHAGDTEGFYAAVVGSTDGHWGVAIMTNGAQGGNVINELIKAISHEYDWSD